MSVRVELESVLLLDLDTVSVISIGSLFIAIVKCRLAITSVHCYSPASLSFACTWLARIQNPMIVKDIASTTRIATTCRLIRTSSFAHTYDGTSKLCTLYQTNSLEMSLMKQDPYDVWNVEAHATAVIFDQPNLRKRHKPHVYGMVI